MELLIDFKPGPLDTYRKKASFDWKKLKIFIESEELVRYKYELVQEIKKNIDCHHSYKQETTDQIKHRAVRRLKHIQTIPHADFMGMADNLRKLAAFYEVMIQFDSSVMVKYCFNNGVTTVNLRTAGTEKHGEIAQKVDEGKFFGCFCMTEIGHGSNTKGIRTTATFCLDTGGFIINTPDFQAAKCWAGILGINATHALVFAQLYTPDGVCHGLHQFVIQIRDENNLIPPPGIIVGDMGEKAGLNGIDNGFLMFKNYHVSYDTLLDKNCKITSEGKYVNRFKDPTKRFGASLSSLSNPRVCITIMSLGYLAKAVCIAIRYSAVRKQFGPTDKQEIPIIEYQLQQYRLLPYLAGTFALKIFGDFIVTEQFECSLNAVFGKQMENAAEFGIEMHGLTSASKPISGWFTRDAIQECREACGGHGYLKASRFGDLRNDNDANCTYEGDNNVLIQQTSNWLLKLWPQIVANQTLTSPMHSIDFLSNAKHLLNAKCTVQCMDDIIDPNYVIFMFEWLTCYLLKKTNENYESNVKSGKDPFTAKNDNQVFLAKDLAISFIQRFILYRFLICVNEAEDRNIKVVLSKLLSLYGLFSIEKHIGHLYQGDFFTNKQVHFLIQNAILRLCRELKDESVALVDAIAPDDFLINSILGYSDGLVYDHLHTAIFTSETALTRPSWWKDIVASKL